MIYNNKMFMLWVYWEGKKKKKVGNKNNSIWSTVQREKELLDVNSCSRSADSGDLRTEKKKKVSKLSVKKLKEKKKD